MSRQPINATLAGVGLLGASGTASAHVKYVTPGGDSIAAMDFLVEALSDPFNLLVLGVSAGSLVVALALYLRFQPVTRDIESLREALVEYHDLLPWLLRLSIGLPLVGAGFSGYFFSPVFRPAASTFVRLFGITVGFLLLFGLATRAVAALGLSAYLIGLVSNPSLLLAFEYLPGFIAIVLLGGGRPSADHVIAKMAADERTSYSRIDPFYRAVALPFESWVKPYVQFVPTVTRVGLGLAFIYLGLTQKLLSPGTALAVVAKYHLTEVVPVAPELWVLGAGLVEMLVGVMLIAGAFTRLFSGVAILLFTTTLFGLPDDPVLAHISLFGLVSALIITGAGPFAFDTIRHGAESEAPPSIVGE